MEPRASACLYSSSNIYPSLDLNNDGFPLPALNIGQASSAELRRSMLPHCMTLAPGKQGSCRSARRPERPSARARFMNTGFRAIRSGPTAAGGKVPLGDLGPIALSRPHGEGLTIESPEPRYIGDVRILMSLI